ncbi:MAG: hypothetical protein A2036_04045 [Omnitrophica bacterium GWA2_50_21]|nr:MAG: hypothetical protein A2036_04045 [Omnitrophica bacterium GWA2_50_21]
MDLKFLNLGKEKLRMRRLIDQWTPAVAFLFSFLKFLQFFKKIGGRVKESGWRTAMKAYSRMEHSKFILVAFRLTAYEGREGPPDLDETAERIVRRLARFFENVPELQWQLEWTAWHVTRKRKNLIDIVRARYRDDGSLESLRPYLDARGPGFDGLDAALTGKLLDLIIGHYNQTRDFRDKIRPWVLQKRIGKSLSRDFSMTVEIRQDAKKYIARVLSAAFVSFETLPSRSLFEADRFQEPHFIKRKHPGLGLLNILCRLRADFDEADLWIQFHHIPVDGVPMQEVLRRLKEEWGTRGEINFPSLGAPLRNRPELCSTESGDRGTYHKTAFIDFRPFGAARKELARKYEGRIAGGLPVISLLLWGLAHHPNFKGKKFFFPVDVAGDPETEEERGVGAVFIRPGRYFNAKNPEQGFIAFQNEFNRRLALAQARCGESHEMLELYALTTPLIYGLTRKLAPKALGEFIGTVGVTMIKDSDLFITPMSETHADGFLAFGNFLIPTEGGGAAGAVSVRGKQDEIEGHLDAVRAVVSDYLAYC